MDTSKKIQTKKKMDKKKKLIIASITVVSIILLLVLTILLVFHVYYGKMNVVTDKNPVPTITDDELAPEPEDSNGPDSSQEDINNAESGSKIPMMSSKDVFNVLLIGIDSRKDDSRGRSDSMILVSINKKTKKIIATSIMRDSFVQIHGHKNNRINAAFAFGGADLLIKTIEGNFKVKVDRYAYINFFSFIDIVNSVGGVTLDVSKDEIPVINKYILEINRLTNQPDNSGFLTKPGKLTLSGKQALGYSRNRYVGNSDFERTARQRRVLEQIYIKAKSLNVLQLNKLFNKILPDVTTNLSEGEMLSYVFGAPTYLKYDVEQFRIPMDGAYKGLRVRGMSVLGIDFDKNVIALQNKIYGKSNN